MAAYRMRYRCQMCGRIMESKDVIVLDDEEMLNFLNSLVEGNNGFVGVWDNMEFKIPTGSLARLNVMHDCGSLGYGLATFIGFSRCEDSEKEIVPLKV